MKTEAAVGKINQNHHCDLAGIIEEFPTIFHFLSLWLDRVGGCNLEEGSAGARRRCWYVVEQNIMTHNHHEVMEQNELA